MINPSFDYTKFSLAGISHHQADADTRIRLSISSQQLSNALKTFQQDLQAQVLIVSTCNRTEIYSCGIEPQQISQWLCTFQKINFQQNEKKFYHKKADAALEHFFKVSCGLDSLILGEQEILGQIKKAKEVAHSSNTIDSAFMRMIDFAIQGAKQVHNSTAISRSSQSYAGIIFSLSREIFAEPNNTSFLLIGSSDPVISALQLCADRDVKNYAICSRSPERAQALKQQYNAQTISWDELGYFIEEFDVIIGATQCTLPIIGKGLVEQAMVKRNLRPMLFADLGIPYNFEPQIAQIKNIHYYHLDELGNMAQKTRLLRERQYQAAQAIIHQHIIKFHSWLSSRKQINELSSLHLLSKNICEQECKRLFNQYNFNPEQQQAILQMAHKLRAKMLHGPSKLISEDKLSASESKLLLDHMQTLQ